MYDTWLDGIIFFRIHATKLDDILFLMLDLAGSLDETAAAICSGNPYDNLKLSDL